MLFDEIENDGCMGMYLVVSILDESDLVQGKRGWWASFSEGR